VLVLILSRERGKGRPPRQWPPEGQRSVTRFFCFFSWGKPQTPGSLRSKVKEKIKGAKYHKVTLNIFQLMLQSLLLRIPRRALNLVIIVVQTRNMRTRELGNFSRRPTNTAADIEDLVAVLDADFGGEVVLVAGDGLVEGLAVGKAAEVEGLAPAVFVEVGSEVIVACSC
jgi:hypothetical protein